MYGVGRTKESNGIDHQLPIKIDIQKRLANHVTLHFKKVKPHNSALALTKKNVFGPLLGTCGIPRLKQAQDGTLQEEQLAQFCPPTLCSRTTGK